MPVNPSLSPSGEPVGRIHSLEHFSTVDGPGIRFVVFLQGCPLRCLYCHNPDTWETAGGESMTVEEVVRRALRYRPYFETSGGGVTLSGGEPLLQADFAAALFRSLRAEGVHTCLDTAGSLLPEDVSAISDLLGATDLVLLDIKESDPLRHEKLTGIPAERPLRFLSELDRRGLPSIVRQVIVPGWTDDDAQIDALGARLAGHPSVREVELLPYHTLGASKWQALGLAEPLAGTPAMDPVRLEALQARINRMTGGR